MIGLDISVKDAAPEDRATAIDRMPTGWLETVGTVFDLANENAPYKSLKRNIARSYADYEDDQIIPMAELNEKYAPIGLTFMEDHKKGYVDLLVEKRLEDIKKQNIISRGPQNIAAQTSYFISGLGGTFKDPINIGSMFVPIVGQARFLGMVGKYGVGKARFYKGLVEGGFGNAMFEPLEIAMANSEQREYGAMNSLYNITFGAFFGAGLHVGLGKIGDVYKKYTGKENIYHDIANAPIDLREDLIKYSIGQLMQGKRINAAAFLEQTNLQRNREMQLNQLAQTEIKANLGFVSDVEMQPATKTVEDVQKIKKTIQQKIEKKLTEKQRKELQQLKKQYDVLETKLQEKKYLKAKVQSEKKQEIDLDIINKDKTLIPYIAKLNSLNKKIKYIEDRAENLLIKDFVEKQIKTKGFTANTRVLSKIQDLKQIYSNPEAFEVKKGEITTRANKINLNSLRDTESYLRNNETALQSIGKGNESVSVGYTNVNLDKLEVTLNNNLLKRIDVDNIKNIEKEIIELSDEISGIEEVTANKFPVMKEYLNKVNTEIKNIDTEINKQDDIKKAIRSGVSCIIKKGL